jgi:hypothetical protein
MRNVGQQMQEMRPKRRGFSVVALEERWQQVELALATATGPLGFAAVIATGVGSLIAAGGIVAGHWMSKKKFEHEGRMERYAELAKDLE